VQIRKVTPATAGDKDFLARTFGALEKGDAPSSPASLNGAHQPRRARSEYKHIEVPIRFFTHLETV
jgi:hypothetical protein